jgi:hypothetical protein
MGGKRDARSKISREPVRRTWSALNVTCTKDLNARFGAELCSYRSLSHRLTQLSLLDLHIFEESKSAPDGYRHLSVYPHIY